MLGASSLAPEPSPFLSTWRLIVECERFNRARSACSTALIWTFRGP